MVNLEFMKKLFKFSGIVMPTGRASDWEFEGYFVKQAGNNDILGVNRDIVGNTFLKGLFIDNQSLIFVEMSKKMRTVRGIKYFKKEDMLLKISMEMASTVKMIWKAYLLGLMAML